ncbi:MAG: TRZ/ATZ family hydrolase [Burkholderiales bacterium]
MSTDADLLISAGWVVPIEPAGIAWPDHAVLVRDQRIAAIGPRAMLAAQFASATTIDLPGQILMPGLVNAHTHAAMTLMRGFADDLPLMQWLEQKIWPAEAKHVDPDFVYDGTLAAAYEMIAGGVTCANDMYFYPRSAAQAFLDSGMRAAIGLIAIEFPTRYASGPDDYLAKGLAVRDQLRGGLSDDRLSFCLAPHAPYTVSDATFRGIVTIAEELDLPIHCHVHETRDEVERGIAKHGMRPLERLRTLGVVSPRLIAVHGVHLDSADVALLAEHGASVVHCPSSNLKLANGVAPISALLASGINIALGTDGAASNNRLDVFGEMRLAALLAKAHPHDAQAFPAAAALHAATLGGARALGLDGQIGSIVLGKAADLIAVDLRAAALQPCYDPISHLVYACGREHVSHVWIAGKERLREGALVGASTERLASRIYMWHNRLAN